MTRLRALNAKNAAVLDFLSKCNTISWINTPNNGNRRQKSMKGMGRNDGTINRLVVNTQTQVQDFQTL